MKEFNTYQNVMLKFMNPASMETQSDILSNAVLGLAGEAGEVADLLKKYKHHGHDFNKEKFCKELGDLLFYVSLAAHGVGVSLEEVAVQNYNKLSLRYPNGFSVEDSKAKKDENNNSTQT